MVAYALLGLGAFFEGFVRGMKNRVEIERWKLMNEYYRMIMARAGWDMDTHTFNGANGNKGMLKRGMEEEFWKDPLHLRSATSRAAIAAGTAGTGDTGLFTQMANAAEKAGFKGDEIPHAVAIAMAESRGRLDAVGSAGEKGVMQINPHVWGQELADRAATSLQASFDAGYYVYSHSRNGFGAWSTDPGSGKNYTPHNSYLQFMPQVQKALTQPKEAAPVAPTAKPEKAAAPLPEIRLPAGVKINDPSTWQKDQYGHPIQPPAGAVETSREDITQPYQTVGLDWTGVTAEGARRAQADLEAHRVAYDPRVAEGQRDADIRGDTTIAAQQAAERSLYPPEGDWLNVPPGYLHSTSAQVFAPALPPERPRGLGEQQGPLPYSVGGRRDQPEQLTRGIGSDVNFPVMGAAGFPTTYAAPGQQPAPPGIPPEPGKVKPKGKDADKPAPKAKEVAAKKAPEKAPTIDSQQRPYLMAAPGQHAVGVARSPLTVDPYWRPNPPTAERKEVKQPNTGLPTRPQAPQQQPTVAQPTGPMDPSIIARQKQLQQPGPVDPSIVARQKQMGIDTGPAVAGGGGGGGGVSDADLQNMQNQLAMMERMGGPSTSDSASSGINPNALPSDQGGGTVSPQIPAYIDPSTIVAGAAQPGGGNPYSQPQQPVQIATGMPQRDIEDILYSRKGGIVWKAQTGGAAPGQLNAYNYTPPAPTTPPTAAMLADPGWQNTMSTYQRTPGQFDTNEQLYQLQQNVNASSYPFAGMLFTAPAGGASKDLSGYYGAWNAPTSTTPTPIATGPNTTATTTATDPTLTNQANQNIGTQAKLKADLANQTTTGTAAANLANQKTTTAKSYTPTLYNPTTPASAAPQATNYAGSMGANPTSTSTIPSSLTGDQAATSTRLNTYAGFVKGGGIPPRPTLRYAKGGTVQRFQYGGGPTTPIGSGGANYGTNPLANFNTGGAGAGTSSPYFPGGLSSYPTYVGGKDSPGVQGYTTQTPGYVGPGGDTETVYGIQWGSPSYFANMPGYSATSAQTQDPWQAAGMGANWMWSSPAAVPQEYIPPGGTPYQVYQQQRQNPSNIPTEYVLAPKATTTPTPTPTPTPTKTTPNVTTTTTATDPYLQSLEAQNAATQAKLQTLTANQQASGTQAATTANQKTTTAKSYVPTAYTPTTPSQTTPAGTNYAGTTGTTGTTGTNYTGSMAGNQAATTPLLRSYAGFDDGGDVGPSVIGPPPAIGSAMGQQTPIPPYYYNPYTYAPAAAPVGKGVSQTSVGTVLPSAPVPTYQEGGQVQPDTTIDSQQSTYDPIVAGDMYRQGGGYPGPIGPYFTQPSMGGGTPGITSRGGISMRGMSAGGGGRGFMGLDIPMPPEFGPGGEYEKPQGAPPYASAVSDHEGNPSPDIIHAIQDGISTLMRTFGLQPDQGIPDQQQQQGRQAFQAKSGVPDELVNGVLDSADPEHQLDYGMRYLAGLGTIYKYYMFQGEPEIAGRVAAGMLMYARDLAQQYGEQALQHWYRGDVQGAAELEAMGYSVVPNGVKYDVKSQPNSDGSLTISAYNMTNKELWKEHVAPEMIVVGAMGLRDGVAFWRGLQSTAGKYDPEEKELLKQELKQRRDIEEAGTLGGFEEQIRGGPRQGASTIDSQGKTGLPVRGADITWPSVQSTGQPQRPVPPQSVVPRATPVTTPPQPGTLAAPVQTTQDTGLPPPNQMAGDINPAEALQPTGTSPAGAGQGTAQAQPPPAGAEARGGVFGRTSPAYQGLAGQQDVTPEQEIDYYSRTRQLAHDMYFDKASGAPLGADGQPVYRPNEPDWARVPRLYLPQVRQMYNDQLRQYEDSVRYANEQEQRTFQSHHDDLAAQIAAQRQRYGQAATDYRQLQTERYGAAKTMQQHQWDVQKAREAETNKRKYEEAKEQDPLPSNYMIEGMKPDGTAYKTSPYEAAREAIPSAFIPADPNNPKLDQTTEFQRLYPKIEDQQKIYNAAANIFQYSRGAIPIDMAADLTRLFIDPKVKVSVRPFAGPRDSETYSDKRIEAKLTDDTGEERTFTLSPSAFSGLNTVRESQRQTQTRAKTKTLDTTTTAPAPTTGLPPTPGIGGTETHPVGPAIMDWFNRTYRSGRPPPAGPTSEPFPMQ